MEILRKNSQNESGRSLFYSSKEIYCHCENALPVFEPRGLELNAGEHKFDFSVPLACNLPSSFKGSHGSIKYKLRVLIQRPWTFDERHTIPVTVVKYMPLLQCFRLNPIPLEKQITKTISLFGTRPISMLALLPEDFAVRGEPLRICVTVTNNSTTNVEKLRFTVLQYILYYSHLPLRIQKMETIPIATKETGAVHKKSERAFAHELLIPASAQPTDNECSGVINITYELRVEAVLRGFFKNLVLNLPFKLYSLDAEHNGFLSNAQPPPNYAFSGRGTVVNDLGSGMGNPFDSVAVMPVYPSLDSAVGSPSHSSQYSESGSLYSTTSDSSAATLSPAVGGGDLSYVSGGSSQFNSPSARASLRSSNVPYMPYASSPMMFNSYPPANVPPYPVNDSPQYTLMSQPIATTTPSAQQQPPTTTATTPTSGAPVSYNSLPTSSAMFLNRRDPPGAHELPPTYDELFGNATAPPATPK